MVFSSQASSNHGNSTFILLVSIKYARAEKANKISFQQNLLRDPIISPEDPSESHVGHQRRTRICLFWFVSFGFFFPLENFSLIWSRHDHHYRWRAANFDLCSAFTAIGQRGFFSVPHLLWNRASVYNGHLRGPPWYAQLLLSGWQWNCPYLFFTT